MLMANLPVMGDEHLAALYQRGDQTDRNAVLTELARRDRLAIARARRRAVNAEWYDGMYADYLAADAETRGNLLSRAGIAAGISPTRLWSGPEAWAHRMASEELRAFWQHRPRVTIMQYARQAGCR